MSRPVVPAWTAGRGGRLRFRCGQYRSRGQRISGRYFNVAVIRARRKVVVSDSATVTIADVYDAFVSHAWDLGTVVAR